MPTYIHELPNWPRFVWNNAKLAEKLAAVRHDSASAEHRAFVQFV